MNPINRKYFFDAVRHAPFGGRLSQSQVEGMNFLLDVQQKHFPTLADDHIAYGLATTYHESGGTMRPIKEIGGNAYFTRMYDINGARPAKARELGNIYPGDGARYPGMGYVQSTGRTNARKARAVIKEVLGVDVDFESDPSKLMVPEYAAVLLWYGMIHGTWTGKAIGDYIDGDGEEDAGEFKNARRVVNGTDRAELIAGYASNFLRALKAGRAAAAAGIVDAPVEPDGKSLAASTTARATVVVAATGAAVVVSEIAQRAPTALDVAAQSPDMLAQTLLATLGPWGGALAVILGGAAVVLKERRKKAVELGI